MEYIKEISALIQLALYEIGLILCALTALLGVAKLFKNQIKDLLKK